MHQTPQQIGKPGSALEAQFELIAIALEQKSFRIGDETVDRQHQSLFTSLSEITAQLGKTDETLLLDQLQEHIEDERTHFADEERAMRTAKYPGLEAHAACHARLLSTTTEMIGQCRQGAMTAEQGVTQIAMLLLEHILRDDMRFKMFLEPSA